MQTLITFKNSKNETKTYIMHGKWNPAKAIAFAKRFSAVDGSIRITHTEIYASKSWQRFEEVVANA